jgi:hypothetical protein
MAMRADKYRMSTDLAYRAAVIAMMRMNADDPETMAPLMVGAYLRHHASAVPSVGSGWSATLLRRAMQDIRSRETPPNRYQDPDRLHDFSEMCNALAQRVSLLTTARELSNEILTFGLNQPAVRTADPESAEALADELDGLEIALSGIEGTFTLVVELLARRWLPAMLAIVAHLPEHRHAATVAQMNAKLNRFLFDLDAWHENFGDMEQERWLWLMGAGALDAAVLFIGPMLRWTAGLAARADMRDAGGRALQERCADGLRQYEAAIERHWQMMHTTVAVAYMFSPDARSLMLGLAENLRTALPGAVESWLADERRPTVA